MDLRIRILEYMLEVEKKNSEDPNFYFNLLQMCYDLELNSIDTAIEIEKFKEEGCVEVCKGGFLLTNKGKMKLDQLKKVFTS